MKFIKDLNELKVGDWIKVRSRDIFQRRFKVGEITYKWNEKNKPIFQLKIIRTNLPISTEKLISRIWKGKGDELKEINGDKEEDTQEVFLLNEEEKNKIIKEMIVENLK